MRFLVRAAEIVGAQPAMLDFGCGPTVHHLFPFAAQVDDIHVADYLDENLHVVDEWLLGAPQCHDWSAFAEVTLRTELGRSPSIAEIETRLALTRRSVSRSRHADARSSRPLGDEERRYPLVLCCFCPDSITDDIESWRRCARNIVSLVDEGGWLVLTALGRADSYRVGAHRFPSAHVAADDVVDLLRSERFDPGHIAVETVAVGDGADHGFSSVILATARR